MKPLLWLCFTLSGASALALELLWMRSASLVVGSTAATTASVLASYFTGLGLGGLLAREAPATPVRRYAILELAASAGALWSYWVFSFAFTSGGLAARVLLVVVATIPATLALGATLPTIGHALASPATIGARGGWLYSLNTLGGVVGIALMGFGLPLWIGVGSSYLATAATSALVAALAWSIADSPVRFAASTTRRSKPGGRIRLVAAGSGLFAIALEVLWVKLFAQVLHNSVYSFAAVSLVFLLAIALGAAAAGVLLRRVAADRVASAGLMVAGLASVVGIWGFFRWTDGLGYFGMQSGLGEYVVRIIALAAATAGPAALASGAVLPSLWALAGDRESVSRPIGDLTACNLAGAVVGAVVTGFVALPALGLRATFLATAVGYVALGEVIAAGRLRALGVGALAAIAAVAPLREPLAHLNAGETLRASAEGASGIVTVVDAAGDLELRLDNFYVLGGSAAGQGERRQGLVPLLLHPSPRRVAFIGMATGISASAAPALGVEQTTVIELVPEVAAMAGEHFAPWNANLLEQSGVRLIIDDGRRALATSDESFDVIVSDLFIPWHASAGSLYAREMYAIAARRLAPGGLFCQWLPLYQLTREEFETIARTFLAVFPSASLWRNDFYPDRPVVGLVGALDPPRIDLDRIGARVAALPDWARDPLLVTPRSFAMLYLGNLSASPGLFAGGPLNTDDRPVIEFTAPRLTRMSAGGDKDWFAGEAFASFSDELAARLAHAPDPLLPASDAVRDARLAGSALFRYAIAARRGDRESAERFETEVRRLVPEVVAAGDQDTPVAALADVQRTLASLDAERRRLESQSEALEKRLGERSE